MDENGTVTGSHRILVLLDQKNIASYRWRDSGDVDFLKESFRGDPRCTLQYNIYVQYIHVQVHTYEADVNLMYVMYNTGESPRWIVSKG